MWINLSAEQLAVIKYAFARGTAEQSAIIDAIVAQELPGPDADVDVEGMYIDAAQDQYASDEINIDADAVASIADDGAWVMAWVWVPRSSVPELSDDEEEEDL